jgi:hypothetical protein
LRGTGVGRSTRLKKRLAAALSEPVRIFVCEAV